MLGILHHRPHKKILSTWMKFAYRLKSSSATGSSSWRRGVFGHGVGRAILKNIYTWIWGFWDFRNKCQIFEFSVKLRRWRHHKPEFLRVPHLSSYQTSHKPIHWRHACAACRVNLELTPREETRIVSKWRLGIISQAPHQKLHNVHHASSPPIVANRPNQNTRSVWQEGALSALALSFFCTPERLFSSFLSEPWRSTGKTTPTTTP